MEIYKAFCLDVAQGHMKGAPNETRTHSCTDHPIMTRRPNLDLINKKKTFHQVNFTVPANHREKIIK